MVTAEPGYIVHAKITAAEIRDACPPQLVDYGERIADDLAAAALYEADAAKYTDKAERHRVSAGHYLSLAAEACDEGGFVAFRARFCPDLGKSRANELRQIAAGKKSPEEIRAKTRDRVARHRARRAPTATNGAARRVRYSECNGCTSADISEEVGRGGACQAQRNRARQWQH